MYIGVFLVKMSIHRTCIISQVVWNKEVSFALKLTRVTWLVPYIENHVLLRIAVSQRLCVAF